jgi:hypothetical protein
VNRTAREDARTPVHVHHAELGDDVLSRVLRWKVPAEGEPADLEQCMPRPGLEPYVIVEEEDLRRAGAAQEVVALLGEPPAGSPVVPLDLGAVVLEDAHHRPHDQVGSGRLCGLVADDDPGNR